MQTDITQTTTITNTSEDFSVDSKSTDGVNVEGETYYDNPKFDEWYGYYSTLPELKTSIDSFATWITGKGFTCASTRDKVILDNITGAGEDTFTSIIWNLFVTMKFNGDSYAHIIRDTESNILINLKPLNPKNMRTIFDNFGIITGYEQMTTGKKFKPYEIFHQMNDRIADNTHGTAVCEVVQWTIDFFNEVLRDIRRVTHNSTIRILYVDEDDKTRLANLKTDYADAIISSTNKNGNVLILPCKKGDAEFQDLSVPPITAVLELTRYLENKIYKAVGFPKSLTGDAEGIPESGGKMAMVTHEPRYLREVTELESDLWNQLAIRVKFNPQASITEGVSDTANKSNAQTGFQPQDASAGMI